MKRSAQNEPLNLFKIEAVARSKMTAAHIRPVNRKFNIGKRPYFNGLKPFESVLKRAGCESVEILYTPAEAGCKEEPTEAG